MTDLEEQGLALEDDIDFDDEAVVISRHAPPEIE